MDCLTVVCRPEGGIILCFLVVEQMLSLPIRMQCQRMGQVRLLVSRRIAVSLAVGQTQDTPASGIEVEMGILAAPEMFREKFFLACQADVMQGRLTCSALFQWTIS
jgi:hypothetical protein